MGEGEQEVPTRNPSTKVILRTDEHTPQALIHSYALRHYPHVQPQDGNMQRNPAQERKRINQAAPADATDILPPPPPSSHQ